MNATIVASALLTEVHAYSSYDNALANEEFADTNATINIVDIREVIKVILPGNHLDIANIIRYLIVD